MDWNPEQLDIFNAVQTTSHNLMVEALPGTGKSTVLVELTRYMKGSVFLCAFAKPAAEHLIAKCRPIVGNGLDGRDPRVRISTTHSLAYQTWLRSQGFGKVKMDDNKIRLMLRDECATQPLAAKHSFFMNKLIRYGKRAGLGVLQSIDNPENWLKLIDHHGLDADLQWGKEDLPQILTVCMGIYKKSLGRCGSVCDFDDQILAPLYYNVRFVRYDNVLIDEAQDTSDLRLHMLLKLPKSKGRVIAVGDSNQAVMGFTGASIDSMREIQQLAEAEVFPLTISYRLPLTGVENARQFAPDLKASPGATLGICTETSLAAKDTGDSFWSYAPFTSDDAILCRVTRPLVELAHALIRQQIPCRVEGREIGQGLIRMAERWKIPMLEPLEMQLIHYKRKEVARLNALMQEVEGERIADQCDTVLALIGACFEMNKLTTLDLTQLIDSIFGDTEDGEAPSMVTLSTIHKAKGREWARVFVLGYHQLMPSRHAKQPWEQREERNLQFISQTRHMRALINVNMPEFKDKKRKRNDPHV